MTLDIFSYLFQLHSFFPPREAELVELGHKFFLEVLLRSDVLEVRVDFEAFESLMRFRVTKVLVHQGVRLLAFGVHLFLELIELGGEFLDQFAVNFDCLFQVFVLFNDKGQVLKIRQLFPGVGNHLAVLDPEFADFLPPAVDRLLGDQVDEKVSQGRYQ